MTPVEAELPVGFVRLAFVDGQPAIVLRDELGRVAVETVSTHLIYKRAIARETARLHRGAFERLAAYDLGSSLPQARPAAR